MKSLQMASFISLVLAIAKGAAFGMTGSLIVLSSFLDSVMDTILSWVNFRLSKESKVNADKQHPYGHGGFEVIGGLVQGFLIGGSGVFIVFQTLERVLQNSVSESLRLKNLPLATGILVFSILGSSIITWLLARSSSKNAKDLIRSLSIEADRSHYQGDVLQNVIALIGLGATVFFENPSIDTIAGGFSGLLLIYTAFPLIRNCLKDIMNTGFDVALQKTVHEIVLNSNISEVKGMHRLRSRTSGPNHFVDFHLKLPNEISLNDAHDISYKIQRLIEQRIPNVDVMIHLDPEDEPDEDF